MIDNALLDHVASICRAAGERIMAVYESSDELEVTSKADNSPVTRADIAAHDVLEPALKALLPGVPVLSEEAAIPSFSIRSQWQRYWLIDPLDGTKEFINRNGEFTVNVALIDGHKAVLGVVYVPVLNIMYGGIAGVGAWKTERGKTKPIQTRPLQAQIECGKPVELVASRHHGAREVEGLIARIEAAAGLVATKSMGSSLKLCLVAEGQADLYPRLALTSEWDTAAAQAVVEAAGGKVVDINLEPLLYNAKADILNPFFYVIGDTQYNWEALLITE
ncbi:3'(2'),5'-bisphosphate nucleotidase CysQ [Teredinibacter franksiae]|uniref:3'(2'),5'-bisphosphate nucleotidase CysQ n=1 Tax=Teredinibacter franksiae TaxID=2761453 RepID=UPI001623BB9E|nr:3'(2'),5'-bisphosphate nucleotidase CysQ [Teredinibacter franksiae]